MENLEEGQKKAKIINQHNAIEILVESQDKNNYNN